MLFAFAFDNPIQYMDLYNFLLSSTVIEFIDFFLSICIVSFYRWFSTGIYLKISITCFPWARAHLKSVIQQFERNWMGEIAHLNKTKANKKIYNNI